MRNKKSNFYTRLARKIVQLSWKYEEIKELANRLDGDPNFVDNLNSAVCDAISTLRPYASSRIFGEELSADKNHIKWAKKYYKSPWYGKINTTKGSNPK